MSRRVTTKDVAQAGGSLVVLINQLVDMVRVGNMDMKERGAMFLRSLTEQPAGLDPTVSEPNVVLIARANAIKPLVQCVVVGSPVAQANACAALAVLAAGHPEYQEEIVNSGGVLALTTVLRGGDSGLQEQAAAAIAGVSQLPASQKTLIQAGSVLPLISLLKGASADTQVHASQALANLANESTEGQNAIHRGSALPLLISLLGSGKAQEAAAHALARLACGSEAIQADITQRGGIPRLIALLSVVNVECQAQAAAALASLAEGDSSLGLKWREALGFQPPATSRLGLLWKDKGAEKPTEGAPVVNEAFHRALLERMNQVIHSQKLGDAELTPDLQHQLVSDLEFEFSRAEFDAFEVQNLTIGSFIKVVMPTGEGHLVRYYRAVGTELHNDALKYALNLKTEFPQAEFDELMGCDKEAQKVILHEDSFIVAGSGITAKFFRPIVTRHEQDVIAKAGGIRPLLALVETRYPSAQRSAVKALAMLALNHRENQDAIAQMGGIMPLVGLCTYGAHPTEVQSEAVLALTEISRHNKENQTAIADAGATSSLVALLRHSGAPVVEAEVAGAMWALSEDNPVNKVSIAGAGAIPALMTQLASPLPRAHQNAANALSSLAIGNSANQAEIASLLVGLLEEATPDAQNRAAQALWRMVDENRGNEVIIAKAGGAEPLVRLLTAKQAAARAYALWSLSLSIDADNQKVVADTGGIKPLVSLLSANDSLSNEQAACAIYQLASKNNKTQAAIVKSGAVEPLITLLDVDEQERCQEYAAAALSELASIVMGKMAVDRAGGIMPLVCLLSDKHRVPASKKYAAAALARLSFEDRKKQTKRAAAADVAEGDGQEEISEIKRLPNKAPASQIIAEAGAIGPLVDLLSGDTGGEAQEEAAGALLALAENGSNRTAITEAGGIGPLVLLLGSSNDKARQHAEGALVRLSIETTNRAIIIRQLVGMLDQDRVAAQEQASAALANLAKESVDNRQSIVEAGGIPRLLALCGSPSAKAKENSMSAISQLAYMSAKNQETIASASGIVILVKTLFSATSNAKETTGVKLCELTAAAIWNMACDNKANQTAFLKEGVIPPMVGLVTNPVPEVMTNAAGALASLAKDHPENQAAIARSGAIPPLCTNVRDGTPETREESAAALWALAENNQINKATVAKLGGIEPLVNMLMYGSTDKSSANAGGALTALATQHADNRLTITKRMVGVLGGKAPPARAVRLLSAIASLCENEPTNQIAIAKSGGIQHLITWLVNSSEEVQTQAAKAMLSVAGNNVTTQASIGKLGGIPPLVTLLVKGVIEAQQHSACAVWHLASLSENRVLLESAGAIEALVRLLVAESDVAQQLAVMTLLRLAEGSSRVALKIAQAGGIKLIVNLLSKGSKATQQMAAAALAAAGQVAKNRDVIANANAISPLIQLLTDKTLGTPETAARALSHLARDDSNEVEYSEEAATIVADQSSTPNAALDTADGGEGEGEAHGYESELGGGDGNINDDDEAVANIVGADARRTCIHQAGGVQMLISMLDGSNLCPPEPYKPATVGGWGAIRVGVIGCTELLEIFKGSQADFGMRIGMQEQAAATLADLACNDISMQDAIIAANGVPPLLSLVRSGTQLAQEHAAATMCHLATTAENQRVIVRSNSIMDLVALVKDGTPMAKYFAAAALAELASGAVDARRENEKQKIAMRKLGGRSRESSRDIFPSMDSIAEAAVRLDCIREAASSMDRAQRHSDEAPPAGMPPSGMPPSEVPLDGAVGSGGENAEQFAALLGSEMGNLDAAGDVNPSFVKKLATKHNAQQLPPIPGGLDVLVTINDSGGIPPLIKLCENGTPGGREKAAAAMWHLAIDNESQANIAANGGIKALVSLLAEGTITAQRHASDALTRLATENTDNQAQIAKRLVGLLDHEDATVVARAATDLQNLAKDHKQAPAVIVNAGAISPLVTVLSNGKTEEGRQEAARTLYTLADSGPTNQIAIAVGLVALLGVGTELAQEYVTQLLLTLSDGQADGNNRKAIAKAGPFKMLVQQLKAESPKVKMLAAAVMSKLSGDQPENVDAIANANGIPPLVALLNTGGTESQAYVSIVLADMTRKDQELAMTIASEGGIPVLAALLLSDHTVDVRAQVASTLGKIAVGHPEKVGECGAIEPLVKLLTTDNRVAQLEAALALAHIAGGAKITQDRIKLEGGIELLVNLLKGSLSAAPEVVVAQAGDQGRRLQRAETRRLKASTKDSITFAGIDDIQIKLQSNLAKAVAELARDHFDNQKLITELGGIEPLIALVEHALTELPKEEAAGALWTLSSTNFANQDAIAAAQGIESLVRLVGKSTDRGQKQAAGALASLALNHSENQTRVAKLLVENLRESSAILNTREKAARALSRFAKANTTNQDALAKAGAVKLIVSLLEPIKWSPPVVASKQPSKMADVSATEEEEGEEQDDDDDIRRASSDAERRPSGVHHLTQGELSSALWGLAKDNRNNQVMIADAGGIPLLIAMLGDHPETHREAAGALWSLSADPKNQMLIAEAKGIPELVELIKYGARNATAQETAAGALSVLAQRAENRGMIADADGIEHLVRLFDGATAETKELVVQALLTLAIENKENQFIIASKLCHLLSSPVTRVEAQEYATRVIYTMSLDRDNLGGSVRDALSRALAIKHIVRQLEIGSEKSQNMASNALAQIALMSSGLRVQVTQHLVSLLSSPNPDVRQRAGAALRDNSEGGEAGGDTKKVQRDAVMSGGVQPLVELLQSGLKDGRVEAQEYSLWSLSMITDASRCKDMATLGCIPALIESMSKGQLSADSQEHAAMVLACLCIDAGNDEQIIQRSGIVQMVALLSGPNSNIGSKKQAALGLGRMAVRSSETQELIAKAGAIPHLVAWFQCADKSILVDSAARALAAIAREHEGLQVRIAEAGAIPPLVEMLRSSTSISKPSGSASADQGQLESHIIAAEALATLALNVPANQAKVAAAGGIPLLVELLSADERRECKENASKAIAAISPDNDNKLLILRAGGIPPLVALLSNSSALAQRYVTTALALLASDVTEIQAALHQEAAHSPLTALLGSEQSETQESAMNALICMASIPVCLGTVVKRLVGVLQGKNTAAQLKSAQALAVLSGRTLMNRTAIVQAGGIEPIVGLLGNGQRADKNTPPERAAAVLADLARLAESKVEIPRAGGIAPLVTMLNSSCEDAQTYAACALRHLSASAENKDEIVRKGGIVRFVAMLSTGTLDGQRHAANALWQVATSAENKSAIVEAGGIPPLVALLKKSVAPEPNEGLKGGEETESNEQDRRSIAESKESAAAVLSELARSQMANRKLIFQEGAIAPLVILMFEGSTSAQKHATCALWGLAQDSRNRQMIIDAEGAVERLVELLRDFESETQGFAAATLVCLANDEAGREVIKTVGGPGPLMSIALGPANWLRNQSIEILKLLGYPDPTESMAEAPPSPRLMRYHAELAANPAVWMMSQVPQKVQINDEHMADIARKFKIGERVVVDPGGRLAEVRYVGKIPEIAPGYWVGVLYDLQVGKNDGAVKGRRLFECPADFGGFVRPDHLRVDPNPPARRTRTPEEDAALAAAAAAAAADAFAGPQKKEPKSARQKKEPKDEKPTEALAEAPAAAAEWDNGAEDADTNAPPAPVVRGESFLGRTPSPPVERSDKAAPPKKKGAIKGSMENSYKDPSPRSVQSPRMVSPKSATSETAQGSASASAIPKGTPRATKEQPTGKKPPTSRPRS